MLIALKTLHLLALATALGGGIARLILVQAAQRQPPTPAFALPHRWLAHLTTGSVVLLWLTGLALWMAAYGFRDLGAAFHMKLAAATLLLMLALYGWTRMMTGNPPPPALARSLGRGSILLGIAAVLLAVTAFNP
jgi:putative copper export protein